jgi:hypothetical protein
MDQPPELTHGARSGQETGLAPVSATRQTYPNLAHFGSLSAKPCGYGNTCPPIRAPVLF